MEPLCFERLLFGSYTTIVPLEKSFGEEAQIIISWKRVFGVKCFFLADCIVAPSFLVADDEMLIELVADHPLVLLMSHEYYKNQGERQKYFRKMFAKP